MNKNIRNLIFFTAVSFLSFAVHAQDWTDGSFTLWNSFGSQGTGDGQFQQADGIAVDENGLIYISDYQLHRIQVFQADGTFVRKWGSQGSGDGQFQNPRGLDIGPDGNLYVCDWGNHRICVFELDGTFVRSWGSNGTGDGQFDNPYRISVNPEGLVFVVDRNNYRVQVFDENGTYIRQFATVSLSSVSQKGRAIIASDQSVFVVQDVNGISTDIIRYNLEGTPGVKISVGKNTYNAIGGGLDFTSDGKLVSGTYYCNWRMFDNAPEYSQVSVFTLDGAAQVYYYGKHDYTALNLAVLPDGSVALIHNDNQIFIFEWTNRVKTEPESKLRQWVDLETVQQRAGYPYLDVDFRANSDDGATNAHVAMCAFLDGNIDLASLIPMRTFVDGTETNLGENVELSSDLERVTWNMAADWSAESGNVQIQAFAQSGPYYLPFNWLTIPAGGGVSNAFQICRTPVTSADLKPVWMFLIASGDSSIQLIDGKVYGTQGVYDGELFAGNALVSTLPYFPFTSTYEDVTTSLGKQFLWERMGLRDPTSDELTWAKEATIPGIQKWTPRYKVGGRPSYINEFGLDTGATTGFWAVKQ